jgi:PAS domain S-box-containing protein
MKPTPSPDSPSLAESVVDDAPFPRAAAESTDLLRLQRSALEVAANAIVITTREGVIVWANPAFTASTGYTLADAAGRTPGELLKSGHHDAAFFRTLWDTITAGKVWRGEIVNRRKDGTCFTEEMTITPLRDPSGAISHFVAVKQDITQRIRLEAQVRQAQKMEAVGQLAGGVAHDFNNLLAAVLMHLGLLHDEPRLDEATRNSLKELAVEVQRGASLTRQLLAFSRQQAMEARPLDLNDVIDGLLKMLRRLLGEQVNLVFESGADLPPILADPTMMEQIVMNLCVNARDAMPRGGTLRLATGAVTITEADSTKPDQVPGTYVRLTVSDTGTGMDAETLQHLFEPFFTTKPQGQGTGLGLATVYGIIRQHQGWIEVESDVGKGAIFLLHFPAHSATRTTALSAIPESAPPAGGGEKILLIEDEATVRRILGRALTKAGYRVLEASDGPEALSVWATHRDSIALLVTDMVLPGGMTGLDLALRAHADRPDLAVLVSSGYSNVPVAEIAASLPSATLLRKPFSTTALLAAVARCLHPA